MSARLATKVLVSALVRRANQEGGFATVLAKGDEQAGALLLVLREPGGNPRLVERGIGPNGELALIPSASQDVASDETVDAYWQRRRSRDPDLWVVELDIAAAERFAAETIFQT